MMAIKVDGNVHVMS
uniref:Uncharacterized protein n=1 Tax=Lepeophtheirus salmonis TaxID=72036 RepID=A0A0K2TV74_LEPSM